MYTIENSDIAIFEEANDEQEAFDVATELADEYPGRKFYIHFATKPYAIVHWENGQIHVKDIHTPVTANVRDTVYSAVVYVGGRFAGAFFADSRARLDEEIGIMFANEDDVDIKGETYPVSELESIVNEMRMHGETEMYAEDVVAEFRTTGFVEV